MSYKCKECGEEFSTERSLHGHFRKHDLTVAEYYPKHFPRFDKHTGKPLNFKSVSHYFTTDFNSDANFRKWCLQNEKEEVAKYLVQKMKDKVLDKGLSHVIGQVQLRSYGWPQIESLKNIFGSFSEFARQVGQPPQFGTNMPKEFYKDFTDVEVWVDTREQKPLNFINPTKKMKLDSGDYAVGGEHFDHTFVDRKSAADFISTISRDLDRLKREIQRCCDIGGYMFIVVDAKMEDIAMVLSESRSHTNIQHIWHNMREVLTEFAGDCQVVFSGGRTNSALLVPKLLVCGKKLWKVDVQYYLDTDDTWLGT
jgi:hypothetical protein